MGVRRAIGRRARAAAATFHNAVTLSRTLGQFRSMATETAVDGRGRALPWFTYPAIEYLSQFDYAAKTVFEFGAGNSTVFWSERAQRVTAVENDAGWQQAVAARVGPNVTLVLADNEADYADAIVRTGQTFDVIVIDGWYRMACVAPALRCLAPGGMIVLDNSDWLPRTAESLRGGDLIQVDFNGFGPICAWRWTTSVFLSRTFDFPALAPDRPHPPRGGSPPPESAFGM